MSDFVIDLATLRGSRAEVAIEGEARELGLTAEEWPGTIRGVLAVERTGDRVTVRGEISGTAHLECVRCLGEFDVPLVAPILVFADRSGASDPREERISSGTTTCCSTTEGSSTSAIHCANRCCWKSRSPPTAGRIVRGSVRSAGRI